MAVFHLIVLREGAISGEVNDELREQRRKDVDRLEDEARKRHHITRHGWNDVVEEQVWKDLAMKMGINIKRTKRINHANGEKP